MAAGAGAAAAAAIAQAIKASGTLIKLEPLEFLRILNRQPGMLVVTAQRRWFSKRYQQYLTTYKGLSFYCESLNSLDLPADVELIPAKAFWMPG